MKTVISKLFPFLSPEDSQCVVKAEFYSNSLTSDITKCQPISWAWSKYTHICIILYRIYYQIMSHMLWVSDFPSETRECSIMKPLPFLETQGCSCPFDGHPFSSIHWKHPALVLCLAGCIQLYQLPGVTSWNSSFNCSSLQYLKKCLAFQAETKIQY